MQGRGDGQACLIWRSSELLWGPNVWQWYWGESGWGRKQWSEKTWDPRHPISVYPLPSHQRTFQSPPSVTTLGPFSGPEQFSSSPPPLQSPCSISPTTKPITNTVSLGSIILLSIDMPILDLAKLTQNFSLSDLSLSWDPVTVSSCLSPP